MVKFAALPTTANYTAAIGAHGAAANHADMLANGLWNDANVLGGIQSAGKGCEDRLDAIEGVWQTFTPTLSATTSNPTMGTGNHVQAQYIIIMGLVNVTYMFRFGTSGVSPGSGNFYTNLPVAADTSLGSGVAVKIGHASLGDNSAFAHTEGSVHMCDGTGITGFPTDGQHCYIAPGAYASTPQGSLLVTDAVPFVWSTQDNIHIQCQYRQAGF